MPQLSLIFAFRYQTSDLTGRPLLFSHTIVLQSSILYDYSNNAASRFHVHEPDSDGALRSWWSNHVANSLGLIRHDYRSM